MNLLENIKEGLRSIKANMLRSGITMAIVVLGIMALVGILTAVSAIENSINDSLASLGVNTFDIRSKEDRGFNQAGVTEKNYPQITLSEAFQFIERYKVPSEISLGAMVSGNAEVKRLSEKSNPNVGVMGANDEYIAIKGLLIDKGRNFSIIEVKTGAQVVILGSKIYQTIFKKENENPIGKTVTFMGTQFRVIGILQEKGQLSEDNYDNMVIIPIIKANQMAHGRGLNYDLTVSIDNPSEFEYAMGEATGLMRIIRHDKIGRESSFELEKSETLSEKMDNMMFVIRIAGVVFAFLTLLGASIALVNIMLVSVTERTREIGLRKALGATPQRIRQQFIIEAIVVCILGGIGGIILGIIGGNLVAIFLNIEKFTIPWMLMIIGLGVCVLVGLISGYYPAMKASKLDPIESLRFE
jgi:putative ABC transport system permease protein